MHVIDRTEQVHARRLERASRQADALRRRRRRGTAGRSSTSRCASRDLDAALAALPDGIDVERPRTGEAYFDLARGRAPRPRRGGDGRRLRPRPRRAPLAPTRRRPRPSTGRSVSRRGARCRRVRRASRSAAPSSSFIPASPARPSGRCSTTSQCSSSRRTSTSPPRTTLASRSTMSSMRRTRYAVFLWGPEHVRVEYVEHKPTFSLDYVCSSPAPGWPGSCAPRAHAARACATADREGDARGRVDAPLERRHLAARRMGGLPR